MSKLNILIILLFSAGVLFCFKSVRTKVYHYLPFFMENKYVGTLLFYPSKWVLDGMTWCEKNIFHTVTKTGEIV